MRVIRATVAVAFTVAANAMAWGCAQENPTEVGRELLPGGVQTYEVILDPSRFIVEDTSFAGYYDPRAAQFLIVARDFQNALNANILTRLAIPTSVQVTDSSGTAQPDTTPTFFGGRVVMTFDSLAAGQSPAAAELRLFRMAEDFHTASVGWNLRLDTGEVRIPWAIPGGTPGSPISSATWEPGTDSLFFNVDSATIAEWADTLSPVSGFTIQAVTPGTRIRAADVALILDLRSEIRPDTTFTEVVTPPTRLFIFDPPSPDLSGGSIAGGTSGWRALLHLKEGLDTLALPCAQPAPGCSVRLGDAAISSAGLLFRAGATVPGYAPEDSVPLGVRYMFRNSAVPLERSPLGSFAGNLRNIPPGIFLTGGDAEVPFGTYIRQFTDPEATKPGPWIALVSAPEGVTFGHAAFPELPRLRLVITVGSELRLR
jgi:hypothetical protein